MTQKVIVQLTDDVDGGEAAETVSFALDGVNYEIDLNEKNAKALREAISSFQTAGRRVSASSRTAPRRGVGRDYNPKVVRAWAVDNKIDVPERGRIPGTVIEQYRAANG
ncbi:Lsr2 family protein [Cellulomonas sp. PS-H5]|uniref:histone-like nucleoid-structuring protein Lsr2 n=1 Tax=Cellulomonas sp. PS-H5 TaxID=2820400 RepID=UPI001C4FC57A|nr:Lsr2 family protein [Cellulomonas sp. PS-H5]MBW0252597.1 Lsr2 family protein [Cellulomonas sp. PS-H5]